MTEPYNKSLTSSKASMEYLLENDVSWLYLNMKQFTESHFTQSTLLFPAFFNTIALEDASLPSSPYFIEQTKENNDLCHGILSSYNTRSTGRSRLPFQKKSEESRFLDNYSCKTCKEGDRIKPTKGCINTTTSSAYPFSSYSQKSNQYSLNAVTFHERQKKLTLKNHANEDKTKEKILKTKTPVHISTALKSVENKILKDTLLVPCYSGETMECYAKRWCNLSLKRLELPASKSAQILYLKKLIKPTRHKEQFQIIQTEKKKIRSELVAFDTNFYFCYGELPTSDQKKPLKPLYGYYRRLKLLLEQLEIYFKNNNKKHSRNTE